MAPSPTIRRLLKETSELSAAAPNPNPAFHAAPVSDSDLHEWHFTLLGPPSPSPYAGGLYHGRITLPATYPLKPPNFRFLTPSGRFETNREICLSISGFHEETWMPAWGVRTALTALRTFMAEKGSAGQVGGLEASKEVRGRLARESRGWRCEGCGSAGRTNEEVMREWWERCREKGVKVGTEGEEVGLELLPEGMNLEARDPTQNIVEDARKEMPHGDSQTITAVRSTKAEDTAAATVPPPANIVTTDVSDTQVEKQAGVSTAVQPTASESTADVRQQSHTTSTSSQSTHRHTQSTSSTTAPITPADPMRATTVEVVAADSSNTTTIDTAIGVFFLALVLMLLKKIFYPAASLDNIAWPDD